MQIIHRESHTEQLFFTTKPDAATRKALREAGWKFNGIGWFRNVNLTTAKKAKDLPPLLVPLEPMVATA